MFGLNILKQYIVVNMWERQKQERFHFKINNKSFLWSNEPRTATLQY